MADDFYNAPGAAASAGINDFLTQQAAQRRQAMLDALAVRKQSFEEDKSNREMDMKTQQHQMDLELKRSQLQSLDAERQATIGQKKDAVTEAKTKMLMKTLENSVPGDIFDARTVQAADELGLGGQAFPKPPLQQQSMSGVVAPQFAPPALRIAPAPVSASGVGPNAGSTTLPPSPEPPAQMGLTGTSDSAVRPYIGNRQDREAAILRQKQQAYIDALPDSDPHKLEMKQAYGAEQVGLKLPPGAVGKGDEGRDLMLDPVSRHYIDGAGNIVLNPTKADRVNVLPHPPDHSMANAVHDLQEREFLQRERDKAISELNTKAKPFEETIRNASKLLDTMAQGTNIADVTIPAQVVKLAEGGMGSGVRVTQPVMDAVEHKSRSTFSDLVTKANRIVADPTTRFTFSVDQLAGIQLLAQSLRKSALESHKKIGDIRDAINSSKNVDEVNQHTKKGFDEIFETPAGTKLSAAELIQKYGGAK